MAGLVKLVVKSWLDRSSLHGMIPLIRSEGHGGNSLELFDPSEKIPRTSEDHGEVGGRVPENSFSWSLPCSPPFDNPHLGRCPLIMSVPLPFCFYCGVDHKYLDLVGHVKLKSMTATSASCLRACKFGWKLVPAR